MNNSNIVFYGKVTLLINGEEYYLHIENPYDYDLFNFAEQFFLDLNYHLKDDKSNSNYIITEINYDYDNMFGPIIGIESFDSRIILSDQLVDKTNNYKNCYGTMIYYIGDNDGPYFIFGQELVGKLVAKLYVNRLNIKK